MKLACRAAVGGFLVAVCALLTSCASTSSSKSFQGSSEVEPNNQRSQADTVNGLTISGALGAGDTEDWFKLGGQEGSRATFTISHASANDFDFEVYSGETQVGRAIGSGSTDTLTADVPSTGYVRVWRDHGEGPYTISISPQSSASTTSTASTPSGGSSQGSSEREPNNSRSQADTVNGLTISGALGPSDTEDWFKLGGQEGSRATFTISHASANDFDFEVYSNEDQKGSATGTGSTDTLTADVPGTGYVRVWRDHGEGPYTITITPSAASSSPSVASSGTPDWFKSSEVEPNDSKGQADRVTELWIDGELSSTGDVDWFVLNGQEGPDPEFWIETLERGVEVTVEFYDGDKLLDRINTVDGWEWTGGPLDGTCYIRVSSASGRGKYTIDIYPDGVPF